MKKRTVKNNNTLVALDGVVPLSCSLIGAAKCGGWSWFLVALVEKSTEDWCSLMLLRPGGKKRCYRFGWNGSRLSGTTAVETLKRYDPNVLAWVVTELEKRGKVRRIR